MSKGSGVSRGKADGLDMGSSLSQPNLPTPLLCSETRAKTAKASLRKSENGHAVMAAIVAEVRKASGLNLDEFARGVGRDPRQIARWEAGTERPQIEAIYEVPSLQPLVVEALAKRTPGCEVVTEIRVRRTA